MRWGQASLGVLLAGLVLGLGAVAWGGEVAALGAGPELRLADGRVVRLAGVELPGAAGDWDAWSQGPVRLEPDPPPRDRWGRLRAQVHGPTGWLQAELVRRGEAVVAPQEDVAEAALAALLALEREARAARRGIWSGGSVGPWPAERVGAAALGYVLVEGRVASVARAGDFVYLNYGRRWREDFTARAEAKLARRLEKAGQGLAGLEGRNLLVRGTLFFENGPMVELVHPAQIEVLE